MGFNKRYIDEKTIRTIIREDGFQTLINYIRTPDTLITEDDFSREICGIIRENDDDDTTLVKLLELNIL